jgi:hypothetical protein
MNKKYKVAYRLAKGNDGQQHMTIEAPSSHMAAKLFQAQFPQFKLCTQPVEVRI